MFHHPGLAGGSYSAPARVAAAWASRHRFWHSREARPAWSSARGTRSGLPCFSAAVCRPGSRTVRVPAASGAAHGAPARGATAQWSPTQVPGDRGKRRAAGGGVAALVRLADAAQAVRLSQLAQREAQLGRLPELPAVALRRVWAGERQRACQRACQRAQAPLPPPPPPRLRIRAILRRPQVSLLEVSPPNAQGFGPVHDVAQP